MAPFAGRGGDCTRWKCTVATPVVDIKVEEEAVQEGPKEIFLTDYRAPDYKFNSVYLTFELGEESSIVHSKIVVGAATKFKDEVPPLLLDGEQLELLSLRIDGADVPASAVRLTSKTLTLLSPPADKAFELEIVTRIDPANNTALEGLYRSSGNFCTQCEAQGFRRITFFQDRPDVMTKFTTRIEADAEKYPVLLSNGNQIDHGTLPEGRHYAVWEDPWVKPSYLFALVAGQLKCSQDSFVTKSGRNVALRIWVKEGDEPKTGHAMRSLIASMKWDEEVFGLEYDLDLFNIVAVPDFNMGAMENKSLNIFNSRLILASPETATDADYSAIEGVVAHEYFHNWTGNRVTCRDWFQLTLKEGLTVYRDQEFSADMNSRSVERIGDVVRLRTSQFSEDSGPMAHPVRPFSYIKMDNFYTVTVYEKGAEVVRMYETLLTKEGFRKGMDLYFERHDGSAVTCDDFFAAMRDANSANLNGFELWLAQAGTPNLYVSTSYDEKAHTFTLSCRQEIPPTPGQEKKLPMLIPLAVGLLGPDGRDLPLLHVFDGSTLTDFPSNTTTAVLRVTKEEQEFTFTGVLERPIPSLLRRFSAPVRLSRSDQTDADLLFLLAHDSDDFNRWEAGQTIARKLLLEGVGKFQKGEELSVDPAFINALKTLLEDSSLDKAFVARVLSLPTESEISDLMPVADPDAIHGVRKFFVKKIAADLRPIFERLVEENKSNDEYVPDHPSKARRALKNTALGYLASLNDEAALALAEAEFEAAGNMSEQLGALSALSVHPGPARDSALARFYDQWKDNNLVMNKWLGIQSTSSIPGNVEAVRALLDHPAFNIREPNKVYALVGGFASCPVNFHAADGSGYKFLADIVLQLDSINGQVASRMVSAFTRWKKYDAARQALAKVELERILAKQGLTENVFEIVSKSLKA